MQRYWDSLREDIGLFFRLWLEAPLRIGALTPSSLKASRAIAQYASARDDLPILELGGGTGSITAALIDVGLPPSRIYTLEQQPSFCELLRRRFPEVTVLEGDAANLSALLKGHRIERLSMVVSSLPIIWFSLERQRAIIEQAFSLMGANGCFIQVTNWVTSPLPARGLGLKGEIVERVWSNFPPYGIWIYHRLNEEPDCDFTHRLAV
jgi:phosphatidylethanolamine/phosphatidyl-N-methylethanolamine N-methyltransferase